MPFVGRKDGEIVTPEEVDDGVKVACLGCEDELKPRSAHDRDDGFVARHFWHPFETDCEGGSGGESLEHQKMKSIAVSKAKQRWPEASVGTELDVGERRADVLVEFEDTHDRLGAGVAIEVQHKHENKDVIRVTEEYADAGYSSIWVFDEHFEGKDVDLDAGDWNIHWAMQLPDESKWGGTESFVDELADEINDDDVQIEVKLPVSWREIIPERQLRRAWFDGFQESWDEGQEYEYRKERYENTDSEWVDIFKRELGGGGRGKTKWIKLVKAPSGSLCLQLGKTTNSGSETVTLGISNKDGKKLSDVAAVATEIGGFVDV